MRISDVTVSFFIITHIDKKGPFVLFFVIYLWSLVTV